MVALTPNLVLALVAAFMIFWMLIIVYWTQAHDELLYLESQYTHDGMSGIAVSALHGAEAVANALLIGGATTRVAEAVEHMEDSAHESHLDAQERFWEGQLHVTQNDKREKNYVHDNLPATKETHPFVSSAPPLPDHNLHVIFSTDCSDYQNWQSITLFYSALLVGQRGAITRIASGCSDEERKELSSTYSKLFKEHFRTSHGSKPGEDGVTFHVHYTPDFKHDEKTGQKYAFYNKPRGLKHWLDNAEPPIPAEEVVALLDPDMIFLRPLTAIVADAKDKLYNHKLYIDKKSGKKLKDMQDYVKTGQPVAQRYGLGAPWTDDNHKKFNRTYICGHGSPCLDVPQFDGDEYYSVGPPYIATRTDFDHIGKSWVDMVPRVHEGYPYLLAEMYAYSMAAAHEKLPHAIFYQYMVSNAEGGGEGWDFVDDLDDVCMAPMSPAEVVSEPDSTGIKVERFFADSPMPILFHYCQHFKITNTLSFYKGGHRDNIMSCNTQPFPMCESGKDGHGIDYKKFKRGTDEYRAERKKKRGGFAVNLIHTVLNRALAHYKTRMC
jgi:peptidyl serine alpha-galactosyltransferase